MFLAINLSTAAFRFSMLKVQLSMANYFGDKLENSHLQHLNVKQFSYA
jgi:hypothetical protein